MLGFSFGIFLESWCRGHNGNVRKSMVSPAQQVTQWAKNPPAVHRKSYKLIPWCISQSNAFCSTSTHAFSGSQSCIGPFPSFQLSPAHSFPLLFLEWGFGQQWSREFKKSLRGDICVCSPWCLVETSNLTWWTLFLLCGYRFCLKLTACGGEHLCRVYCLRQQYLVWSDDYRVR